jgi:hypothetical protein
MTPTHLGRGLSVPYLTGVTLEPAPSTAMPQELDLPVPYLAEVRLQLIFRGYIYGIRVGVHSQPRSPTMLLHAKTGSSTFQFPI